MNETTPPPFKMKTLVFLLVVTTIISTLLSYLIKMNLQIFLDLLYPVEPLILFPYNLLGLLLMCLGFILIVWANYTLLIIGKISLANREPFHIPESLVREGPYRFSRNPIYLSAVILVFGLATLIGSLTLLILSLGIYIILRAFFISWEEKKLEEVFGEDYREYKRQVRRWL
ncbi:MAG: methyltransferase family protein [Candidatus Hodarchaeales archaeon]|jgi:protein-S-isoprenylcysteine O-methyltransferase Ste14